MLVMRKICMTNHTDKYIQAEPFRAPRLGQGSGSAFFFQIFGIAEALPLHVEALPLHVEALPLHVKALLLQLKALLLPFQQKIA